MKFALVRPCDGCPFRVDKPGYLTGARASEIMGALLRDASFSCHKTNDFVDTDDGDTETVETEHSQHCAGALILLERLERPNQMMRWMERIGCYDRTALDMSAPVAKTPTAFIAHHRKARR